MLPEVTREIGGKLYSLRFSARTTIAIEHEFGAKIQNLKEVIGEEPDITTTARLVKLCLRLDGKMLTEGQFEELLDQVSIQDLAGLLTDAMQSAAPKKAESGN